MKKTGGQQRPPEIHSLRIGGSAVATAVAIEIVGTLLGLLFGITIPLLKDASELVLLALDDFEVIVSELTPLLFDFAFELLPISRRRIGIHHVPPHERI
jgi:hypothetical protein